MEDETLYKYDTPEGYSDIFFIYVFDANAAGLVDGNTYNNLGIPVTDGEFVCRAWNGAYSVLDTTPGSLGRLQIYGAVKDKWWDLPVIVYTENPTGQCTAVFPEKVYPNNGFIRFDLVDAAVRTI